MIRVCIIGITGYVGEELLNILSKHPNVNIVGIYGRENSNVRYLNEIYDRFGFLNLKIKPLNVSEIANICDVVFLALPHSVSLRIVPCFINTKIKVIDLSADFRLSNFELYEKWYDTKYTDIAKKCLDKAVYGLVELNNKTICNSSIIANPGCYPTSIILGCAPAIKNDIVETHDIIIDSKSGISGAGRNVAKKYFDYEHPNFRAYNVVCQHRHIPEIEQELSCLFNNIVTVSFTPYIIPVERGMLSTIYMKLKKSISVYDVINEYKNFYSDKKFVKILDENIIPSIKDVINTNYCKISIKIDNKTKRLVIFSAIDNLIKGASGQAVQNMNIVFDLPEYIGLN
jgi:N-acetyl-gamma-glutamyl-phosphate reductase